MIKFSSFRIRIALLSAILAGSALVGLGLISWWLIYQEKVSRLDAKLESQLMRLGRPISPERWQFYEAFLPRAFEIETKTPIALLVVGADGNVLYRSQQWVADLDVENLWRSRSPRAAFPSPHFQRQTAPFPSANSRFPEGFQPDRDRPPEAPPFPEGFQPHRDRPPEAPPFSEGFQPDRDRPPEAPPLAPRFATRRTAIGTWRVGAATFPNTQIAIAVSLNALDREMVVIRNIFLISIPGVLLLVAGGAWGIAGSILHSIRRLTTMIGNVTAYGLEQRIPIGATDLEFVELIQVFNQMLERLERSFKQASRFSADAAHELKTPLAILQGELERTLQQAEPGSDVQQSLSDLLDEVRRMSGIVRKLLLLSLADAGQISLHRIEVDLSGLLNEILEDIELLAPPLEIHSKIAEGLSVQGDRDLLIQVLQNLISNAIKYNVSKGWIRIEARRQSATILITISNSSPEIPVSDRSRIFDRFYRGDPARTRRVEGIGLGLSIAREIARSHGGDLTLDPIISGQTALTLTLPVGLSK